MKVAILLALTCSLVSTKTISKQDDNEIALTLNTLHLNDIHAHFEEVNESTGRYHADQAEAGQCYGGMERIHTKVNEIRNNSDFKNVLLLNAGDYYQGTIWYTMFKYSVVVEFAEMLNYDAMALGNHEFDDRPEGLAPFVDSVSFDVLAANLEETSVKGELENVKKSKVQIMDDGTKVGIIGYVTTDTPQISNPGESVKFVDEIDSIRAEAQRLRNEEQVQIIIALGHSGYELDQKMAAEIEELDVVVGGHSHTFLYTGDTLPSIEEPLGPYPTYVEQPSGKVVPVVQAYCFSKYLGHLTLNFNANGDLIQDVDGQGVSRADVILLDKTVEKSPEVGERMKKYRDQLQEYYQVIGETTVDLMKNSLAESNIGNFLADSMVDIWQGEAQIGFINNGGIRANLIAGDITGEDVFNVLPFNNTVDKLQMMGSGLRGVMESYVGNLCPDQSCYPGTFLQMSGLQVVYDIYEDNVGQRISSIQVRCNGDEWCDLEDDVEYSVAVPSFLSQGGSRTANFPQWSEGPPEVGPSDYVAMEAYVIKQSPISTQIEGRLTINYHPGENAPTA